ncbi:MAG: 50S ribosomal protein L17 [Ignavibacteriae bacterium]|nr:MAG: 50S ribosomal protein L17 [Ignavibacteriota bacterium]
MRHRIKGRKLGRTASHRAATLRALTTSLIKYKKITTTLAKAKQLRIFAEPIITKAKNDTVHARRIIAKDIKDKKVLQELFNEVVPAVGDRPGGYTRIVKLGNRVGDAAEMAIIELVDYNDLASNKPKKTKQKTEEVKSEAKIEEKVKETVAETSEDVPEVESLEADDLTKIEGIGPKISQILQEAGIKTFAELSKKNAEEITKILEEAGGRFKSHNPATWADQAKLAAEGKWDELKKWQDELDGGREK